MTDKEISDILQDELESTYIDENDVERRKYDDVGAYIAGVNKDNVDILFSIETGDQKFVFGMLDILMEHYTDQYSEFIVVVQFYDEKEETEDSYMKVTRVYRKYNN